MKAAILVLTLFAVGLMQADDKEARKERVREHARQKAYQRRIQKEWETFQQQFVTRQTVPIYSGAYLVGWNTVVTPNYPAIWEYRRQLDLMAWNSMNDQQRRDLALFTIAHNTGVIADNTRRIARGIDDIARGVEDIAQQQRRDVIQRMIDQTWPRKQ